MSYRQIKVLELVDFEKEPPLSISDWLTTTRQLLAGGARPVSVFSQRTNDDDRVWMAFAPASAGQLCLTNTVFAAKGRAMPFRRYMVKENEHRGQSQHGWESGRRGCAPRTRAPR